MTPMGHYGYHLAGFSEDVVCLPLRGFPPTPHPVGVLLILATPVNKLIF